MSTTTARLPSADEAMVTRAREFAAAGLGYEALAAWAGDDAPQGKDLYVYALAYARRLVGDLADALEAAGSGGDE